MARFLYRSLINFYELMIRIIIFFVAHKKLHFLLCNLHLQILWIIVSRDRNYARFSHAFNKYSLTYPELFIDFQMQLCLSSTSKSEIEYFQKIKSELQRNVNYLNSSARLISNHVFLANTNTHAYLDAYLKSRILMGYSAENIYVCLSKKDKLNVKNQTMLEYWSKYVKIIEKKNAYRLFGKNLKLFTDDVTWCINVDGRMTYIETAKALVEFNYRERGFNNFLLTSKAEHINDGKRAMLEIGLPPNAWFVVIHVRDNGYQNGSWQKSNPYDDYRNADIESYREALNLVASLGGYIVRIGDPRMKPLDGVPKLIDYFKSNIRSTYLDTYLLSNCKFFIGTSSGPILTSQLFGRPTLATNFAPINSYAYLKNGITISKKYYSKSMNRFLTLREVLQSEFSHEQNGNRFSQNEVLVIPNTSNEIVSAVKEMNQFINGSVVYSDYENKLQDKVKKLYLEVNGHEPLGRFGAEYLKQIEGLID